MSTALLVITDVSKRFAVSSRFSGQGQKIVHALDGVSLSVMPGDTLGLVGESGCGKSTLGRFITRLYTLSGGTIRFAGTDISTISERQVSTRIAVMYLGSIVEMGQADDIFSRPSHPYTQALISAVPVPDITVQGSRNRIVLTGDLPSPINPPSGCRFHTRRPIAQERCKVKRPKLEQAIPGRSIACHFPTIPAA